jgi:hypothetical protein
VVVDSNDVTMSHWPIDDAEAYVLPESNVENPRHVIRAVAGDAYEAGAVEFVGVDEDQIHTRPGGWARPQLLRSAKVKSALPEITEMYCLPSTWKVTGAITICPPRLAFQSSVPVLASSAWK